MVLIESINRINEILQSMHLLYLDFYPSYAALKSIEVTVCYGLKIAQFLINHTFTFVFVLDRITNILHPTIEVGHRDRKSVV